MKFGLKLKMMDAVREDRLDKFLNEIPVLERLDVIRATDAVEEGSFRAIDASSIASRYNVYTDILNMSLTQFILLEYAIKGDFNESLIAKTIIRPKDETEFDNTDQEKEEMLISSIYEEDAIAVSYIIKSMMNSRDYVLFTKFEGVIYNRYELEEGEEEEGEPEEPDPFTERWFWYSIVRTLANEDLQKFQYVYDMKMSDVLVELAYRVQLSKRIEAERRAEESRRR
jgi:hypothetical protein